MLPEKYFQSFTEFFLNHLKIEAFCYIYACMKKVLPILLAIFALTPVQAQSYWEEVIDVSVGYGLSVPYDELGYFGSGVFAQGEYLFGVNEWLDLRAYAGYTLAEMKGDLSGPDAGRSKSTANAVLFGGKARARYPFEWVAPFAELGVGGSLGSFETVTQNINIDKKGLFAHIPFSLGVELGSRHMVSVKLTSYFHTGVRQFTGAMAVGLRIPIGYY